MRRIGAIAVVAVLLLAVPSAVRAKSGTDELLQVQGHSLVRFDVRTGAASWLYSRTGHAITSASWSPDGREVAFSEANCDLLHSCESIRWRIRALRLADGRARTLKAVNALWVGEVSWAPRGGEIAYRQFTAFAPTWPPVIVNEIHRVHAVTRVHRMLGTGYDLAWHPSGKRITYRASTGLLTSDLRGVPAPVTPPGYQGWFPAWSPDGTSLAFVGGRGLSGNASDVHVVGPNRRPRALGSSGASTPSWSPDGRSLAVADGRDVAVVDVATGERRSLGNEGYNPVWSASGRLIATTENGWIRVVDADTGSLVRSYHSGSTEPLHWRPHA